MKRYFIDGSCECGRIDDAEAYEDENGEWIKYEDYEKEQANGIKPQLCEVPKCEAERYLFGKVLFQRLNKDCLWYAVCNGQIIDVDRYRSDLEERVRHFA